MKAIDKAKELVDKFYNVETHEVNYGGGGCTCPAKEYALICVDELINFTIQEKNNSMFFEMDLKYWNKVKEEIENL